MSPPENHHRAVRHSDYQPAVGLILRLILVTVPVVFGAVQPWVWSVYTVAGYATFVMLVSGHWSVVSGQWSLVIGQKKENREERKERKEKQVGVGPLGPKKHSWRSFLASLAPLSERSERAVQKDGSRRSEIGDRTTDLGSLTSDLGSLTSDFGLLTSGLWLAAAGFLLLTLLACLPLPEGARGVGPCQLVEKKRELMFLGSYTRPISDFSRPKTEFLQKITKGRRSEVGGRN